jgi:hypothetical protein
VLDHFGFRVVSDWVGLGIRSFSVELFWVLDRIRFERVRRIFQIELNSVTSTQLINI